jgi:hypothetical protein
LSRHRAQLLPGRQLNGHAISSFCGLNRAA